MVAGKSERDDRFQTPPLHDDVQVLRVRGQIPQSKHRELTAPNVGRFGKPNQGVQTSVDDFFVVFRGDGNVGNGQQAIPFGFSVSFGCGRGSEERKKKERKEREEKIESREREHINAPFKRTTRNVLFQYKVVSFFCVPPLPPPLPFGSNPTRANDSMGSKMPIFNIRAWLRTLVAMFAMAIAAIRSHLC